MDLRICEPFVITLEGVHTFFHIEVTGIEISQKNLFLIDIYIFIFLQIIPDLLYPIFLLLTIFTVIINFPFTDAVGYVEMVLVISFIFDQDTSIVAICWWEFALTFTFPYHGLENNIIANQISCVFRKGLLLFLLGFIDVRSPSRIML